MFIWEIKLRTPIIPRRYKYGHVVTTAEIMMGTIARACWQYFAAWLSWGLMQTESVVAWAFSKWDIHNGAGIWNSNNPIQDVFSWRPLFGSHQMTIRQVKFCAHASCHTSLVTDVFLYWHDFFWVYVRWQKLYNHHEPQVLGPIAMEAERSLIGKSSNVFHRWSTDYHGRSS